MQFVVLRYWYPKYLQIGLLGTLFESKQALKGDAHSLGSLSPMGGSTGPQYCYHCSSKREIFGHRQEHKALDRYLSKVAAHRSASRSCNNRPDFTSHSQDRWLAHSGAGVVTGLGARKAERLESSHQKELWSAPMERYSRDQIILDK